MAVALVLPESGILVACDRDKNSLEVAKRFYDRAGVSHKVTSLLHISLNRAPLTYTLGMHRTMVDVTPL